MTAANERMMIAKILLASKRAENLHLGTVTEEPTFSAREEEMEEEEEEEEQALIGKEDLALRVDGTSSRERLMGITARVGGTTRPWYSKSLRRNEKQDRPQGSQNI